MKDLIKELESFYKNYSVNLQEKLEVIFNNLLVLYPDLKEIHWTQYTDYFNDGSPTEFNVNEFCHILVDGTDNGNNDLLGVLYSLERIDKNIYLQAFGDHVSVSFLRKENSSKGEFEISSYKNHD